MALSTFALVACLFYSLSFSFLLPRGNITTGLPPLKQTGKQGNGVLKVPISKASPSALTRRQDSNPLSNVNNGYLITCSIGTPPQLVYTQIDTGSSDLWVDPTCANANSPAYCAQFPVYYPGNSSTESDAGEALSITYGTGSVSGEYLIDNVVLGNAKILQQQFGWAETSTFPNNGIMGIGLGYGWTLDYYNIVDQLYVQGFTNSRAFSLDLASIDVTDGAVIFGGVDTMKYIGSLYKSPMIPYYDAPDGFPRYWFYMTSVGITKPGATASTILTTTTYNQAMFPDSGATLSQLPPNLFNALISFFPTAVSIGNGVYTIDCSIRSQAGTIDFGFGTKIVHVSYHEWFWQAGSTCYFGGVSNADTWSLGDSFIRSAYIVYDQDNFNIHIAQAANCGTNVIPIGSGANAVPSSVGACTSTSSATSSSSTSKTTSSKSSSLTTSSSSSKITASSTISSTKVSTTSSSSKTSTISPTLSSKTSSSLTTSKSTSSVTSTSKSSSSTSTPKTSSSLKSTSTSSSKSSASPSSTKTSTSSSSVTTSKSISTSSSSSSKSSTTNKSSSSSSSSKSSISSTKMTTGATTTVYITVMPTGTCTAVGQVY